MDTYLDNLPRHTLVHPLSTSAVELGFVWTSIGCDGFENEVPPAASVRVTGSTCEGSGDLNRPVKPKADCKTRNQNSEQKKTSSILKWRKWIRSILCMSCASVEPTPVTPIRMLPPRPKRDKTVTCQVSREHLGQRATIYIQDNMNPMVDAATQITKQELASKSCASVEPTPVTPIRLLQPRPKRVKSVKCQVSKEHLGLSATTSIQVNMNPMVDAATQITEQELASEVALFTSLAALDFGLRNKKCSLLPLPDKSMPPASETTDRLIIPSPELVIEDLDVENVYDQGDYKRSAEDMVECKQLEAVDANNVKYTRKEVGGLVRREELTGAFRTRSTLTELCTRPSF